jgi:U6 snRNA-associated Sm-like protein LSm7
LAIYIDTKIIVSLQGGRKATGILKGFDLLQNMVLDNVLENGRDLGLVLVS